MSEKPENAKPKLTDYLYILVKWRKFLIINMVIILALATLLAFLIPKEYKAVATVMIPQSNSSGLGGLSSLVSNASGSGGSSIASIGASLLGVSNTSQDVLLGILNSRTTATDVIKKFDLMEYYGIKDSNMDKAIKAFSGDVSFDPDEYGMIEISVINESPKESAHIANYLVSLLDSINIELNIQQARNNRIFVEKRYLQNVRDLKRAEDSLYNFQKKYGVVDVPDQLQASVKAAAEIEAKLTESELTAHFVKQQVGNNSPLYKNVENQVNILKNKVEDLKYSNKLSSPSNVLFPFKELPSISMKYMRYYAELQLQQTIMQIVLPMYEQAKVEEQKSIPTIQVLDKAVPPELKYSPKKAFIILGIGFLFFFIFVFFVYRGESAINRQSFTNPLEKTETKLYSRVVKFYRLKF